MITNIDDNLAILMEMLDEEGLADNTILVFITDNGTASGILGGRGYDGGMRGMKNSEYEGGHRVPFILRWPDGKIQAGKSIETLTAHIDILPTFIELCGLEAPEIDFDGTNISELLYSESPDWSERTLVVESQRVVDPIKWRKSAVMNDRWRLVNGEELFELEEDPKQGTDISKQHPEVYKQMREEYDKFWNDVSREHVLTSYMVIGSDQSPIVSLSSHDWLIDKLPPWNQGHIVQGVSRKSPTGPSRSNVRENTKFPCADGRWRQTKASTTALTARPSTINKRACVSAILMKPKTSPREPKRLLSR